ncbi:MAG: hypothetical protein OHK0029_08770 [Armatimonadaceae bacterium]
MRFTRNQTTHAAILALLLSAAMTAHAQTEFRGTGGTSDAGGARDAFDNFLAAAGATPRRITWEGTPIPLDAPQSNQLPINNNTTGINTNRFAGAGAFYDETYAVSNDGFASVNPTTGAGQFPAFSGTKTFAAFAQPDQDEFTIEQRFVVPGTNIPAATRGFGAIFMDVEIASLSSIEYFSGNTSLGTFFVDPAGDGGFSFLGVLFDQPIVTEVVLTLGNKTLFTFDGTNTTSTGGEDIPNGLDLVATDDFVFANPTAAPEPGAGALLLLGLITVAARFRRPMHR